MDLMDDGEKEMIKDKVLSYTKAHINIYSDIVCIKLLTEEEKKEIAHKSPSYKHCLQECYVIQQPFEGWIRTAGSEQLNC
jgi:hypothetical protein